MVLKGKHRSYVLSTLTGVQYDGFKALFEDQKPFKEMVQPRRDEALQWDWDLIQSNLPPLAEKRKGKKTDQIEIAPE